MNTVTIILLIILVVLIGAVIALYFFGKKAQKRQEEQQAQIEASKQVVSMLVIDKKRLPIKQSGLPQMVIDQTPRLMRRQKLPIVKAKVGPRMQILIADEKVFDLIPLKKEIKAEVSGLYIVGVKGIRGSLEAPQQKKGLWNKLKAKATGQPTQNTTAQSKSSQKSQTKGNQKSQTKGNQKSQTKGSQKSKGSGKKSKSA